MKQLILIVDDNPKNVQVLGKTLFDLGYNIAVANSGIQAIDSIQKTLPDLILLDIQMPEMDGFEVCARLKEDTKTKDVPIIFLTAVTDSNKVIQGFELGAVDYITKPFNTAELAARVATHLEIKLSREKLSELNAMKDKFFRIIAHDLRNPFVGIIGLSENMQKILTNPPLENTDKLLKYAQIIFSSSSSAASLLENLLEWARSQSGKIDLHLQALPLQSIFAKNINLVSGMALEKGITILAEQTDETVIADENLLNTILRNLLTNAIKFTAKSGRVTLNSRKIGKWIEVSVQDTGVGIQSQNIDKIFRIDSKFTNLGTDGEKGSGLGLILCKEFVEKLGGKIWVTSEIGKGTTFTFTLPEPIKDKNDET